MVFQLIVKLLVSNKSPFVGTFAVLQPKNVGNPETVPVIRFTLH